MFDSEEYALIDFGEGRKLERFGPLLLDRPSPAADGATPNHPEQWDDASARFVVDHGGKGRWNNNAPAGATDAADVWSASHGQSRFLVQLNTSGNVGLFPEQAGNWDWIADQVGHMRSSLTDRRPRVLNLFAYTGGSTLAAAAAGAEVTHVDSSGPTVAWAKRNADASGMADLPVRWLVEDAVKFVERESRRGNVYDGIILDPPTYGHGPKGRPFKFGQQVDALMALCAELLAAGDPSPRFLLFSCHVPGYGPADAVSAVSDVLSDRDGADVRGLPLNLSCTDGRTLPAGVCARWSRPAG
jgi:23S rRNA (cytosine1962-C5)-methyltransferase